MTASLLLFLIGFIVLIGGSQILIKGATSVARLFKVSNWVIGAVIVGIGTSIPEMAINIASAMKGYDLGVGTVIGSNTFNILFILGFAAIITPITMRAYWVKKDFVANVLTVGVFAVLAFILGIAGTSGISRLEGVFLLLLFMAWIWYVVKHSPPSREDKEVGGGVFSLFASSFMIVGGLVGVYLGGEWVVNGAQVLAKLFGASDNLIGLTIVGIGTSLPELAVTITAALNKKPGIAVGNVIGSNVFDFLGIFGLVALLKPLEISAYYIPDTFMTLAATLLLLIFMFIGKKYSLGRIKGFLLVILYIAYLAFLMARG